MTFPGIESAPKEEAKGAGGDPQDGQDGAAPAEEEVDDGFTPEQRRKNALETDGEFKKYLMMYRMKIPLVNIRNKIEADGVYTKADIDVSQCALFDIINRFVWIFYSYSQMKLKYKKLISVSWRIYDGGELKEKASEPGPYILWSTFWPHQTYNEFNQ